MMQEATLIGKREGWREWLVFMACMSLGMGIFNLTPILPFDGGQVLWVFLRKWAGWDYEARLEGAAWNLSAAVACIFLGLVALDAVRAFWPEPSGHPTPYDTSYMESYYDAK